MNHRIHALLVAACLLSAAGVVHAAPEATATDAPSYTEDGRLKPPIDYREWIYLTSGLDMNYREHPSAPSHSMFDNVFVRPDAYRAFVQTGTWPEGTILVKEARGASSKGSINKAGQFQTADMMGMEAHIKDSARFPGGWAFFAIDGREPAAALPKEASCYACHRDHAAVDTTFVQFYPTLIDIATRHGTLSPSYQKDEAAAVAQESKP